MKILHRKKAFTLTELLVAIVFIVVFLVCLLGPHNIFGGSRAIKRAQMVCNLNNARQIYLATDAISIDNEKEGRPTIWPSSSGTDSNMSAFINELGFSKGDVKMLMAAPGIVVTLDGEPGSLTIDCKPNPSFRFYAVGDRPDDGKQVFLSSFNVQCTPGSITIDEDAVPFGGLGGVIVRRDGSGETMTARVLKRRTVQDSIPQEDQAPDLNWR